MADSKKPFVFDAGLDMESAIMQAIGAASMCWSDPAGAGEFQSERAAEIGEALLVKVRSYLVGVDPGLVAIEEGDTTPLEVRAADLGWYSTPLAGGGFVAPDPSGQCSFRDPDTGRFCIWQPGHDGAHTKWHVEETQL